jgi:hypothetical protein
MYLLINLFFFIEDASLQQLDRENFYFHTFYMDI